MLKSFLTIAWRNFKKHSVFSFLNILGLSTGLACAILIYLWVNDEYHVDKFHTNRDQLYQVMSHIKLPDGIHTQEYTPGLLAAALRKEFPEMEYAVAVQPGYGNGNLSDGTQHFKATPQFVDKDFFQVFSYRLLQGKKENIFQDKYSVLLSDELALKIFHDTKNVIGKTIYWEDDKEPYTVSGVFEKPGTQSSAQFDLLFSYALFFEKKPDLNDWQNSDPSTYFVAKQGTDIDRLSKKLKNYLQQKSATSPLTLSLQKYSDRYLHGNYENGVQAGGRIQYVQLFSIIAVFILVLACINFMNLSTARASGRLKEVGIKKVAGATRFALISQYLAESMFITFLSFFAGLVIVAILLPEFNRITGKQIGLHTQLILPVSAICMITGLAAGIYPALYLSGFKPVAVLKGNIRVAWAEVWIRKGLVIFQYSLTIIFIVSVLVIYRQSKLIQTINLGYNKSNMVSIAKDGQLTKNADAFLEGIKKIPAVLGAATMDGNFSGATSGNTEKLQWEGQLPGQALLFYAIDVDYDLLRLMEINMESGRIFSKDYGSDSLGIILNQAAVDAMGMKQPIGKIVKVWGGTYHIIGITDNFHYASLYEKVKPCFIRCINGGNNILVKISAGHEHDALASIGKLYQRYNTGVSFEFSFLDQQYNAMYIAEQRVAVLSRYFAGLAIIISSLGLFGLATFSAQKRKKELGIRKVIGASVGRLTAMLTLDFIKLLGIALTIAFPVSWWIMGKWLDNFAYRVQVTPLILLMAGASVMMITLVSIGFQSFKAAITNPVKSLRSE